MDIAAEWEQPSDAYGVKALIRNLIPLLALYALAPMAADFSALLPWCLWPAIGLMLYRLTIVMHDCCHGTLFSSHRLNGIIGLSLGAMTGIDARAFQTKHREHHRHYGKADDPQHFHYAGLAGMSRPQLLWHTVKPLLGLNLAHVFAESLFYPSNAMRALRSGEWVTIVFFQVGLLTLITGGWQHPVLALLPALSAGTFGLFFSQLRGIAEHGIRSGSPEGFVRSHAADLFSSIFLYDLNFNYHKEHHLYPQIPSCHLPALSAVSYELQEKRASMWSTLLELYGK